MDDITWQLREESERRQHETFRRLHRPIERGYTVEWAQHDDRVLTLEHPGTAPDVMLSSDGTLTSIGTPLRPDAVQDKGVIRNQASSDVEDFDRWIVTVTPPTWKQRGRRTRERFIVQPLILVLFVAMSYVLVRTVEGVVGWAMK